MSVLSQCPGKRAGQCYYICPIYNTAYFSLSQCPGKRASHCYHLVVTSLLSTLKLSQCPGKRASHCYPRKRSQSICRRSFVSMPWKAGESLLPQRRNIKTSKVYSVSMPWKAGESLLQTPFWRPVALGLVSPESLTYPPDPLRNQNKEFGTPFCETVYLLHAALISLNLPHSLKSLTSHGLSAFVRPISVQ